MKRITFICLLFLNAHCGDVKPGQTESVAETSELSHQTSGSETLNETSESSPLLCTPNESLAMSKNTDPKSRPVEEEIVTDPKPINPFVKKYKGAWSKNEPEYPRASERQQSDIELSIIEVTSTSINQDSYNYSLSETDIQTRRIKPIVLDIRKNTGEGWELSEHRDVKCFKASSGFGFSKIIKSKRFCFCKTPVVIWEGDVLAKKVCVKKGESGVKHLAMILTNNVYYIFKKDGRNGTWEDITASRHQMSNIKLFDEHGEEITNYTVELNKMSVSLILNHNTLCHKIKHRGRVIWDYDIRTGCPGCVYLNLRENNLYIKPAKKYQKLTITN